MWVDRKLVDNGYRSIYVYDVSTWEKNLVQHCTCIGGGRV